MSPVADLTIPRQLADPYPGLQHVARHGASLAPTIEADSCPAVLAEAGEAAKKHYRPLRRAVLPQFRNLPRPHHREPNSVPPRSHESLTNRLCPPQVPVILRDTINLDVSGINL